MSSLSLLQVLQIFQAISTYIDSLNLEGISLVGNHLILPHSLSSKFHLNLMTKQSNQYAFQNYLCLAINEKTDYRKERKRNLVPVKISIYGMIMLLVYIINYAITASLVTET